MAEGRQNKRKLAESDIAQSPFPVDSSSEDALENPGKERLERIGKKDDSKAEERQRKAEEKAGERGGPNFGGG